MGVLIAFYGNLKICVENKVNDNDGRVLILEATINGSDYLLINLYNANTEKEQLTTIKNLNNLLKDFEDFHDKKVIFACDFNLIFDKNIVYPRGYVIPIKSYSLSNKNISLVLYNGDLIIFSFLTVYKNM